jgi:preprotein translocase subunit SecF
MFEIFKVRRDLPFMKYGKPAGALSLLLVVVSIAALLIKGLNLGVDFTGGTVMEVGYNQPADIRKIRATLAQAGLAEAQVQNFGSAREVLIRLPLRQGVTSAQLSEQILAALRQADQGADLRRVDFVGPQVGAELLEDGILGLVVVAIGMMIYLAMRFEWRFSVGAITASFHDVILILGCFALFQWDFNLTVLAAVLAILGYSVNDTVVVFDRIRENFKKMRRAEPPQIIDNAVTATLSRTIITGGVTLLMVLAMLFFGGEVLYLFALALTIGILVGSYSSIFVASSVVLWLGISREDFFKAEKKEGEEGENADAVP